MKPAAEVDILAPRRWLSDGDYECHGEHISDDELTAARDRAVVVAGATELSAGQRSCWRCNPAHVHFLDGNESWVFWCFDCGRWYLLEAGAPGAIDITDDSPDEDAP